MKKGRNVKAVYNAHSMKYWQELLNRKPDINALCYVLEFGPPGYKKIAWFRLLDTIPDNDTLYYVTTFGLKEYKIKAFRLMWKNINHYLYYEIISDLECIIKDGPPEYQGKAEKLKEKIQKLELSDYE